MYQCVHVRKEERRGGSREKEKGTESKHGGGVEERERKLWIEIERREREREGEWMVVERGRSGGKAEFAKKGDGERGWRKDGKSEVGRATRRLEGGERERERVEERPVSSSRQWRRVSPSLGGEIRKNGGGSGK